MEQFGRNKVTLYLFNNIKGNFKNFVEKLRKI